MLTIVLRAALTLGLTLLGAAGVLSREWTNTAPATVNLIILGYLRDDLGGMRSAYLIELGVDNAPPFTELTVGGMRIRAADCSADGRWLALVAGRELYVLGADDAAPRLVETADAFRDIEDISITRDGRTVFASALRDGQSDLFAIDTASGHWQQITNTPGYDLQPNAAPDGARLFFQPERPGVWLMNGDGSAAQLWQRARWYPAWSPDGTLVTLETEDADGGAVDLLDWRSGVRVRLGEGVGGAWWWPDGGQLGLRVLEGGSPRYVVLVPGERSPTPLPIRAAISGVPCVLGFRPIALAHSIE